MAYDVNIVLGIVKTKLGRVREDTALDDYLVRRISAADEELAGKGIRLAAVSARDTALLADVVVDQHRRQEQPGPTPEWLRLAMRERWLQERRPPE